MARKIQAKNIAIGGRSGQRTVFIQNTEKTIAYFRQISFYGRSKWEKDNRGEQDKFQFLIDKLQVTNPKSIKVAAQSNTSLRQSMAALYSNLKEEPSRRGALLRLQNELQDWKELRYESDSTKKLLKELLLDGCIIQHPKQKKLVKWNKNLFDGMSEHQLQELKCAMQFCMYADRYSAMAYALIKKIDVSLGKIEHSSADRWFEYQSLEYHSMLDEYYVRLFAEAGVMHHYVDITYLTKQGIQQITVIPVKLVLDCLYGRTHAVCFAATKEKYVPYVIRMDQIARISISDEVFEEDFLRQNFVQDVIQRLEEAWSVSLEQNPTEVELLFHPDVLYQVQSQQRFGERAKISKLGDRYSYRVCTNDYRELKSWILGFGDKCKVLTPQSLAKDVQTAFLNLAQLGGEDVFLAHPKKKTGELFADKVYEIPKREEESKYRQRENLESIVSNEIFLRESCLINYLAKQEAPYKESEIEVCKQFFLGSSLNKKNSSKKEMEDIWNSLWIENEACEENEAFLRKKSDGLYLDGLVEQGVRPVFRIAEVAFLRSCIKRGILQLFMPEKSIQQLENALQCFEDNIGDTLQEKEYLTFDIWDMVLCKGEDANRDDFHSKQLIQNMKLVSDALENGEYLEYDDYLWEKPAVLLNDGKKLTKGNYHIVLSPFNLEYSGIEQRIRVHGEALIYEKEHLVGTAILRPYVAKMQRLKKAAGVSFDDDWQDMTWEVERKIAQESEERMTFMIADEHNAFERILSRLEGYEHVVSPCKTEEGKAQLYKVEVKYPRRDHRRIRTRMLGVSNYLLAIEEDKLRKEYCEVAKAALKRYE